MGVVMGFPVSHAAPVVGLQGPAGDHHKIMVGLQGEGSGRVCERGTKCTRKKSLSLPPVSH